jgi:DNA-directed RNA polymerase subunit RPC12/RpoP
MSEFKYACPVCGQHIKCDSSQAGTVMDCPTCFQKITVPQAPADQDQKFILTGTKASDKRTSMRGLEPGVAVAKANKFSGVVAVVMILAFMGAAAATIYWATIIHPRQTSGQPVNPTNAPVATRPEKPPVVAPPANDANWMLMLDTNTIPDSPVAGRIHAQNFIVERATFQNGNLTLRQGTHGAEFGAIINFSGATPEQLSGKTINVTTNAEKAAKVTLRWKDDSGKEQKVNFDSGYALRLEFGELANNHLPGKIYLCIPDDEKSYLLGSFNADARKPKPKAPK